jgi:MSHA biogenesis protein MshI
VAVSLSDTAFTPVDEYVPDYSVGGASYGSDYSANLTTTGKGGEIGVGAGSLADSDRAQRFVVEVQRSLDLWDRSWSSMPLSGLRVYAGERTGELAEWLGRETGQSVSAMEVDVLFSGLQAVPVADQAVCLPLLGVLLRTESRKL